MNKSITIEMWDNGGETIDRYTIAISGLQEIDGEPYTYFMGASDSPFHPQGFGQHGHEIPTWKHKAHRGGFRHLGKRVKFYELPPDVQRFITNELIP